MYKKGDLVEYRGGLATVMRDEYTTRFLGPEDEEMIAHGMGHLAGTYGGAVDLVYLGQMNRFYKISTSEIKLVESSVNTSLTT